MIKTNIYVAIPVAVILVLVTRPIARRISSQEEDPGLYRILMAAAITHLLFCSVQLWVVDHIYHGVTDYNRYINQGAVLARRFDHFNFSLSHVQPPVQVLGQGSVSIAAGVVMAIVGVNKLALFYVFSWLAFLATLAFYRAFSVTFPEANRRRYAWSLFFLPSLLFWTSGISKECMMFLSLGLCAYGAARVMAHQRGGAVMLVVGTIIGVYVRPQELLLFMAAFAVAGLFRRKGAAQKAGRGFRRLAVMGLQAVLLLAAISLSQKLAKHAPVFNLAQLAQNNRGQASSINYKPGPQYYFRDVYFVLFDPLPVNAHGSTQKLAAFENTVIILLFLTSLRRFVHLVRTSLLKPYVLLCVMYAAAFPYAFAALNNLGLIDRERVLLLPFLLVPLCIPLHKRKSPQRYPWEASERQRQRSGGGGRWGAPVPARR
ncbi:MAG TPA: hypothetical protein VMB72_13775 [Acidimicrobiales bacterium]|nr:hypothetical protein [Acidimicrobiales bacterium]